MRKFITSTLRRTHTVLIDVAQIAAAIEVALNEYSAEMSQARLPSARLIGCAAKAYVFFDGPALSATNTGVTVCGSPLIETFNASGATTDVWVDCDVTVTVPVDVFTTNDLEHIDSVALLLTNGDVTEIYTVVDGTPHRFLHLV